MTNTLFLCFEGMQSWGEHGRWTYRDTAPTPTRSGVVGILAAAQGLVNDADLAGLSNAIRLGVRIDRQGDHWVDFHTVVSGVLTASGQVKYSARRTGYETQITLRSYLADARFLVAVQSEPRLIETLAEAIQNPCWVLYLGRRNCIPTRPIYEGRGDYEDVAAALTAWPLNGERWSSQQQRPDRMIVQAEVEATPDTGYRRYDVCRSNSRRQFGSRYVRRIQLAVPVAYPGEGSHVPVANCV